MLSALEQFRLNKALYKILLLLVVVVVVVVVVIVVVYTQTRWQVNEWHIHTIDVNIQQQQ